MSSVNLSVSGKRRKVHLWAYASVILLVFFFFLVTGIRSYRIDVAGRESECFNTLDTAKKLLETQNSYSELIDDTRIMNGAVVARGLAVLVEQSGSGYQHILDKLNKNAAEKISLELLLDDGKYVTSFNRKFPAFNPNQIEYLGQGQHLIFDDYCYFGYKSDDFLLILKYPMESDGDQLFGNILDLCASEIFVFDPATGNVIATNTAAVKNSINKSDHVVKGQIDDNSKYRRGSLKTGDAYPKLARYYRFVECDVQEGVTACALYPLALIIDDMFIGIVIPFVLALIFAVFTLSSCIRLSEEWKNKKLRGLIIKLFGKIEINSSLSVRVASMIGVCALISLLFSVYFIVLPAITDVYVQVDNTLESVDSLVSNSEKKKEAVRIKFEEGMMTNLSYLEFVFRNGNGKIDDNILRQFEKAMHADAITVFDGDGNIEYDTKNFARGYRLSSNPNSKEYELWEIINGEAGAKAVYCDDSFGKIFFAASRSDKAGMIRVTIVDGELSKLAKLLSTESAVQSVKFPENTIFLFGKTENPTHLTCYDPSDREFTDFKTVLPGEVLVSGYNGNQSLRGESYRISTRSKGDNLYIFANGNFNSIVEGSVRDIGELFVLYLIIGLIIFKVSGVGVTGDKSEVLNIDSPASEEMLSFLDETMGSVFRFSLVAIIALLLLDYFVLKDVFSLKYWLISNDKKGFTVFSVGYAFFVIVIAAVVSRIISKVSLVFCRCIPRKKVTTCQLLTSLLKFLVALWATLTCLMQFNVSASRIVAFLGISGVALGLGAKDVINDLVSGAFIIMDHHINVGDYIDVENFFGKVVEINIRTTKVQSVNKVVSINNSNMRNIVNNSAGFVAVSFEFVIYSQTNIDEFAELINENAARYTDADVNHVLEKAPKCRGIVSFEPAGVRVSIGTAVKVQNKANAEFLIRNVTKTLLDEHGIKTTIDFPVTSLLEN